VPDIVACYKGLFLGIECKAGKGKTTALQQKNLDDIAIAGGFDWVVNETNMHDTETWIKNWACKDGHTARWNVGTVAHL
jgi:Holliday junction resolvase